MAHDVLSGRCECGWVSAMGSRVHECIGAGIGAPISTLVESPNNNSESMDGAQRWWACLACCLRMWSVGCPTNHHTPGRTTAGNHTRQRKYTNKPANAPAICSPRPLNGLAVKSVARDVVGPLHHTSGGNQRQAGSARWVERLWCIRRPTAGTCRSQVAQQALPQPSLRRTRVVKSRSP